jgi:catechol 2,3-dioxygenase-like lactoylglutathione lyase family enzyme
MLADKTVKVFAIASDLAPAKQFYTEKLGLKLLNEDSYGVEFELKGAILRVSLVGPDQAEPKKHTVLGWSVPDILETLHFLTDRGVVFERYDFLQQDENGIWVAPDGTRVAWFKDAHGNLLSIDQKA